MVEHSWQLVPLLVLLILLSMGVRTPSVFYFPIEVVYCSICLA